MAEFTATDVLELTAQIVAAHATNNELDTAALPALIHSVYQALAKAGEVQAEPEPLSPAVPWKKSVFPDFIICLEDGKRLTMLKRHLKTSYNMTPDDYRRKWSLPKDYPMVAPNYAARRSELAKSIGLGRKPAASKTEVAAAPARRGKGVKGIG